MLVCVTHVLSSEEAASGAVRIHPDLEALDLACSEDAPDGFPLAGVGSVVLRHDARGCVAIGPSGWLGAAVAGDLLGLQWDGDVLVVLDVPGPMEAELGQDLAAALRAVFDEYVSPLAPDDGDEDEDEDEDDDPPIEPLSDVVFEALERRPDLFAVPTPPLSQVVSLVGLEIWGEWIGEAGTDWEAWEQELDGEETPFESIALANGLDQRSIGAAHLLVEMVRLLADAETRDGEEVPGPELVGPMLGAHDGFAPTLVAAAVAEGYPLDVLDGVVEIATLAREPQARAAAFWAKSAIAERRGDVDGQERLLRQALAADRAYGPALDDASWFASDRGDASRAASLLAQMGVERDNRWRIRLESFARPGPAARGRNEPCGCGSGRKFKTCCARMNGWPIDDRLPWLYDKTVAFLHRPDNRAALVGLLGAWTEAADADERSFMTAVEDPLLTDLALFEGGVLERFVERRGALLPLDEQQVVTSWLGRPRNLCEVVGVRAGVGLTLRDVLRDEVVEVEERAGSRSAVSGQHVLVHLLPDAAGALQIFGGIVPVPEPHFPELLGLLDAGAPAEAVASWWGARMRLPTLINTDGEPTIFGRVVLSMPAEHAADAGARLAMLFEDDGGRRFTLLARDGSGTVHGSITVEGDRIVGEANSEARLDVVAAYVQAALPGAEVLDRAVRTLAEVLADRAGGDLPEAPELPPGGAEAVEQFIRDFEVRWCDEPVPALGGLTPRQALDTPVARDDLHRLLAEMEAGRRQPGTMDADRVRGLLGL